MLAGSVLPLGISVSRPFHATTYAHVHFACRCWFSGEKERNAGSDRSCLLGARADHSSVAVDQMGFVEKEGTRSQHATSRWGQTNDLILAEAAGKIITP